MALRRRAFGALLAVATVAAGVGLVAVVSGPLAAYLDEPAETRAQADEQGVPVVDLDTVFADLDGAGGLSYFDYRYGRGRLADPLDPAAGLFETEPAQDETVSEACHTRARAVGETRMRPVTASFIVRDLPVPNAPSGSDVPVVVGQTRVASVYAGVLDEEALSSSSFAQAWVDCVSSYAEEGTQVVATTVAGVPLLVFTSLDTASPGTPQVDAVVWLEEHLEVWVFGFRVSEGPGSDRLQERTNGVEPAVEVAEAILTRNFDETEVLVDDAFTAPPGVVYGFPEPGVEDRVRSAFRLSLERNRVQEALQPLLDRTDAGVRPDPPEVVEGSDANLLIRRAEERQVVEGAGGDARVQVVVWDPAFLNTRAFRRAWRQGIELSVSRPDDVRFAERPDAREYAVTTDEGRTEVHWISDCYTVKVAATDESSALELGDEVMAAQAEAAQETFGVAPASDDTRKAERRRDRRNVAQCARPRLAELRSSVQTLSTDRVTQRKLEQARDAVEDSHRDDGSFPADPDLLEVVQPSIDFRGGVAEATSEVDPVFVLAGSSGESVCLSARSPSDTLYMVKVVATGDEADPYDVTYAEGTELPQRCGPGPLSPRWDPVREDPEVP